MRYKCLMTSNERLDIRRNAPSHQLWPEMEEPTMTNVAYPSNIPHARPRQPGGLTVAEPEPESAEALQSRQIRLLTSRPLRDIRREPCGGFAGPVGPDAL